MSSDKFGVDGQLLLVLPKAAASYRSTAARQPILRSDETGHYLEMRVDQDPEENDISITRRVVLSKSELVQFQKQCHQINLETCRDRGLSKALEAVSDRRIQRLLEELLNFLNPRHVKIILFLYREAARQNTKPSVEFRSNDLLEFLGYSRDRNGCFSSRDRSKLNQDLVALHRTELVFAQSLHEAGQLSARLKIKSILRIVGCTIENVSRDFDLAEAANYTYQLADTYSIELLFDQTQSNDAVFFPTDFEGQQEHGVNNRHDYRLKLLVYLASRLKRDNPSDGQTLVIAQHAIFKHLELKGTNLSRKKGILWKTINELRSEGYLLEAQQMASKNNHLCIHFRTNPEKISLASTVV